MNIPSNLKIIAVKLRYRCVMLSLTGSYYTVWCPCFYADKDMVFC